MSTTPGIYHFFGRVMNQQDKPVADTSVILIKRVASEKEQQDSGQPETAAEQQPGQPQETSDQEAAESSADEKQYEITSEEQVAVTDNDGNYAFVFEPLTAENFWVLFIAEGYRTRSVELDRLMRSRFWSKPNKSPIKLDVVLEKE